MRGTVRKLIFRMILSQKAEGALSVFRPRRLLIWAVNQTGSDQPRRVRVVGGACKGMELVLSLGKTSPQEAHYWLGTHERTIQKRFVDLIQKNGVVWDIGSYLGLYAITAARATGLHGSVYAFDLIEENVERIRQHAAINGLEGVIQSFALGIGAMSGNMSLREHTRSDWTSLSPTGKGRRVKVSTVDDLVRQGLKVPDLIKIDVEGYELDVLQGALKTLARHRPIILCEIHSAECATSVWQWLISRGYDVDVRSEPNHWWAFPTADLP